MSNDFRFSFFRAPITNTTPARTVTLIDVYNLIVGDKYVGATNQLRMVSGEERKRIKRNLDFVTFSGVFTKRAERSIIKHSNLICIDFDHIGDVDRLKTTLVNDEYFETQLAFRSPSGDGLKWVVDIDTEQYSHLNWFTGIKNYIKKTYNLDIDNSCKDKSRACFLCYDREAYINPKLM